VDCHKTPEYPTVLVGQVTVGAARTVTGHTTEAVPPLESVTVTLMLNEPDVVNAVLVALMLADAAAKVNPGLLGEKTALYVYPDPDPPEAEATLVEA